MTNGPWPQRALSSLCVTISSGGTPSRGRPEFFVDDGHLWVKSKELLDCAIATTEERISDAALRGSSAKMYPPNTVLVAMYGANVGQLGWLQCTATVNQAICALVSNPTEADARYLFYVLMHTRRALVSQAFGAAQQNLNQGLIQEFKVPCPPLPTQQRIARILSAYDDLIENNTRRIAILEEMARSLYREWFVKFRFPGHEEVAMVDSPIGPVPEGWNVVSASAALEISPATKVPKDGEKPFIPMNGLSNDSMVIANIEARTGNGGAKFKNGDTLFARITPCLENGKTGFVQFLPTDDDVAFGSTEFIVLRSRALSAEFVYLMARSDAFRDNAIKSMSGATGRQRVQEACFDRFDFAHPPAALVSQFSELTRPHFRSVHLLHKKNGVLRKTRDLLLPRLISGELDVSHLDIDMRELSA